jgi:hypothetical protein
MHAYIFKFIHAELVRQSYTHTCRHTLRIYGCVHSSHAYVFLQHRADSSKQITTQEAYQHKCCPNCRGNAQNKATALRYGRVLKQQAAALTQQKWMHHVSRQLRLLDGQITGLRSVEDATKAVTSSLMLIKEMDRLRTETAHMLRKGGFSFRQQDHPLSEPLPALRARVLTAAVKLAADAAAIATPERMYAVRVSLTKAGCCGGLTQPDSRAQVPAIREVFRSTEVCLTQLVDSLSVASATRLIEAAVPTMATYAHVVPAVRDFVSRCLAQLLRLLNTSRESAAKGSLHISRFHDVVAVGLNCIPPMALHSMTDMAVQTIRASSTTQNTVFWREILEHAHASCVSIRSTTFRSGEQDPSTLDNLLKMCKGVHGALRALWGRAPAHTDTLNMIQEQMCAEMTLILRGLRELGGSFYVQHASEVEQLAKMFKESKCRNLSSVQCL